MPYIKSYNTYNTYYDMLRETTQYAINVHAKEFSVQMHKYLSKSTTIYTS